MNDPLEDPSTNSTGGGSRLLNASTSFAGRIAEPEEAAADASPRALSCIIVNTSLADFSEGLREAVAKIDEVGVTGSVVSRASSLAFDVFSLVTVGECKRPLRGEE